MGYPASIRMDQESGLIVRSYGELAAAHSVRLQFTGTLSHYCRGNGVIYHEPLRQIFCVIRQYYKDIELGVMLGYAVKNFNNWIGPNEFFLLLLIFRTIHTLSMDNCNKAESDTSLSGSASFQGNKI